MADRNQFSQSMPGIIRGRMINKQRRQSDENEYKSEISSGPQPENIKTPTNKKITGSAFTNRKYRKKGEKVLVNLDPELKYETTAVPVNRSGFPKGKGKHDEEKKGPYTFVLATVDAVHFGDDAVYYSVRREDTKEICRAERDCLEQLIPGSPGEKAAIAAASRNRGHFTEEPISINDNDQRCTKYISSCRGLAKHCNGAFYNGYRSLNNQASRCLEGKPPFSCEIKLTSVFVFRLCSCVLLIFDLVVNAFPFGNYHTLMTTVMYVSWLILLLELLIATFIRPSGYSNLMASEKAYSPKAASYINNVHLFIELLSLALFAFKHWQYFNLDLSTKEYSAYFFSATKMSIDATYAHNENNLQDLLRGSCYFMTTPLRLFGLVRYWRNDWLNNMFAEKNPENNEVSGNLNEIENAKAEKIGTALMMINSHRTLFLCVLIAAIVPPIANLASGGLNTSIYRETDLLHQFSITGGDDCSFLQIAVENWEKAAHTHSQVMWAQVNGTGCDLYSTFSNTTYDWYEKGADRACVEKDRSYQNGTNIFTCKKCDGVRTVVMYDVSKTVRWSNLCAFLLQLTLLIIIILSLKVLRNDASQLVLTSLRRMLRIVIRYAENPLLVSDNKSSKVVPEIELSDDHLGSETTQLISAVAKITDLLRKCWGVAGAGIISANLKRTKDGDTVLFNPTVPGKEVYALFSFVAINDFSHILKALDQEVVRLINEVAKVVHNEVFRWGYNDRGQCNKNNGGTFLMVYKIGDFNEVREKEKIAAELMFRSPTGRADFSSDANPNRRKAWQDKMNSIQLSTLPGINGFTDRALLGMLKSFSGIRKEESLKRWETSFELGAGVGAYAIELLFGMHAGWAVEGAVGSGYKIDATYLSPHVNTAARMMSACKQYGVFLLLSQSFEELLSKEARSDLRHIDTVTVKGSEVAQRIYTYDIRHSGVQFFLLSRTEEGSNKEADNYTPEIWSKDQDLKAMRGHISPEFITAFKAGREYYISGDWKSAVAKLKEANNIMIHNVVDDGNIEEVAMYRRELLDPTNLSEHVCRLRHEIGDGPCKKLISFMEKSNCVAPPDWQGINRLLNK